MDADVVGTVEERRYGGGAEHVADLHLPGGRAPSDGWPVVVLVHGGFWKHQHRRDLMTPLAHDLVRTGWAAWNVEYRRVGPTGGGVPATLVDVAAATDHLGVLAARSRLDLGRVAVVGHSAGGHLALWLAARHRLPAGAPGASPTVVPVAAVAQAAVTSLRDARSLGGGAVDAFLGGSPDEVPDRYALADPLTLVGHGVATLLVHGAEDDVVPLDQSERYEAAACAAGDPVELRVGAGDHYAVIDPTDELWAAAVAFLERHR